MAHREIEIGYSHQLFGRFHGAIDATTALNLFRQADQSSLGTGGAAFVTKLQALTSAGLTVDDGSGIFLVALTGTLFIPDPAPEGGAPLVLIAHGQAPASQGTLSQANEVKSFAGYKYLQEHLAAAGVASLSVNLNVQNYLDLDEDYLHRVQILLLHYILVRKLLGQPTTAAGPLFAVQTGRSAASPLHDVLALSPPFSRGSAEEKIHALKSAVNGRIDPSHVGCLGHSRGANAAADLFQVFSATAGTAPTIAVNRGSSATVNPNLVAALAALANDAGNPARDTLKTIVALQPAERECAVDGLATFFLAIASSHDEDVQENSINIYEFPSCPKAMVFSHGASHGRFNTVWRELPGKKRHLNRDIRCQEPIRMLSNRSHEDLARSFVGDAFIATLRAQPRKLLLYTGEVRSPAAVDVERAWRFSMPFDATPPIVVLDTRVTDYLDVGANQRTALSKVALATTYSVSSYAQAIDAFKISKPASATYRIDISISSGDALSTFTHFSFRFAKDVNVSSARALRSEPMRNFSLALFASTTPIGSAIDGSAVPSLIHRPYPTRQWSIEVGSEGGCYDDTKIVLQTVEVPLTRFFPSGGQHTISDLSRVDRLEVTMLPSRRSGSEGFVFVDFLLTHRTFPPP